MSPQPELVSGESGLRDGGSEPGCGQRHLLRPQCLRVVSPVGPDVLAFTEGPWAAQSSTDPRGPPGGRGWAASGPGGRLCSGRLCWGPKSDRAACCPGFLLAAHEAAAGDTCCSVQFLSEVSLGRWLL